MISKQSHHKHTSLKKMFYLKFFPTLIIFLSKACFNLHMSKHFTSRGKEKTSLKKQQEYKCMATTSNNSEASRPKRRQKIACTSWHKTKGIHVYKWGWGRPKRKVLMISYAKIQSQVVAKGKRVRKVTNEFRKLFVKRWENYLSAKPKRPNNASHAIV